METSAPSIIFIDEECMSVRARDDFSLPSLQPIDTYAPRPWPMTHRGCPVHAEFHIYIITDKHILIYVCTLYLCSSVLYVAFGACGRACIPGGSRCGSEAKDPVFNFMQGLQRVPGSAESVRQTQILQNRKNFETIKSILSSIYIL